MKDRWIKINSFLGMVSAMRNRNFVDYNITPRNEIFVLIRLTSR